MSEHGAAAALDALIERGPQTIVVVDDRLRIARAGSPAAALADRSVEGLLGRSLIAAFGSAELDATSREALATRRPAHGEATFGDRSPRTFEVTAIPLAGGAGLVVSLHDVTPLRRLERVRRDFVANIGHELRTPLASVRLLAETLAPVAAEDPGGARDLAEQITREVDHLNQLVTELLDLATIESGQTTLELETLEPDEVIAALRERIAPVAERRGISVRSLAPTDPPPAIHARGDRRRLGQALLNLAHNAVKFSRPEGEIRLGWEPSAEHVRFSVADDGIGVPARHQPRIFERFYKVDRSRTRDADDEQLSGSAGLGLAIVRHIAEAHGGTVGMESVEGAGSTFWVEVPRADR